MEKFREKMLSQRLNKLSKALKNATNYNKAYLRKKD